MFTRLPPAAPLSAFVELLWHAERDALPHRRERSLPTGRADIVIPLLQDGVLRYADEHAAAPTLLRGAVVQGAHDRAGVRGTGGPSVVVGVHFRPGGAVALFGGALRELRNRTVPLDEVWGPAVRGWRERLQALPTPAARLALLQSLLAERLRPDAVDPMVQVALAALRRDLAQARIEPLQRASGCSPARFIARFEQAVGLTPKRFARVLRFHALLPSLVRQGPRDWAQVAVGAGYFDQSHLIHEFRRLAGVTPADYAPVSPDAPTHVPIAEKISNTRVGHAR